MSVAVVPTGTANIASVLAGLSRLGAEAQLASTPELVERAHNVVLPGVGSFGAAAGAVEDAGLRDVLRDRINQGRPTLAICVGMQLLAAGSDESQDAVGLGVVSGRVRRFDDEVVVPQLGWNEVSPSPDCRFVEPGWAYFANSYRFEEVPDGWSAALSDHGGRFVAAMERGDVLACQFHPELSGIWGQQLLSRWLGSGR